MTTKRTSYTASFKLEVLKFATQNGMKCAGRKFSVQPNMIRYWRNQKEKLEQVEINLRAFRGPKGGKFEEIDEDVLEWLKQSCERGLPVTHEMLMMKAREVARDRGIGEDKFKASRGWAVRFMGRHGLTTLRKPQPSNTLKQKKNTDSKTKNPKETRAAKGSDEQPVKREVEEVEDDDSVLDEPIRLNLPVKSEDSGQSSEVISNDDVRSASKTSSNDSASNDGDITSDKIGLPVITATCSLANQIAAISNHQPTDEYTLLGEEVATRVRQLPTSFARCLVRYKIQQLLFEASMGKYDHPTPAYILPETLTLNENSGSSSCSLAEEMYPPSVPTRFTCRY